MSEALRELLADWLAAKVYVISESSSDLAGDYRKLIEEAKGRAEAVGVPWDDALVPPYVLDTIAAEDAEAR
jgi:hypothetical protein